MQFNSPLDGIQFFADEHDPATIYAQLIVPGDSDAIPAREIFVSVDNPVIKSYIRRFILPKCGKKTSEDKLLQKATDYFRLYGCPDTVSPKIRVGGGIRDGLIEYSLYNSAQEYVKVTPEGWQITTDHEYKFLHTDLNLPQARPVRSNKSLLQLMSPYANVTKRDLILLCCWLVQSLSEGPRSALLLMARRGSGKTWLSKALTRIISNTRMSTSIMPEKHDSFVTALTNSYVVALDNSGELSRIQSDILCSAISGSTVPKRILYTTNDVGVYKLRNTVIINGIDIIPAQSDLAERCILLNLKKITEDSRISEHELLQRFEADLPEILGAVFTALSKAMNTINTIQVNRRPRMIDSYEEQLAVAEALGVSSNEFEEIYFENIDTLNKARSEIAIVEAIREYMNGPLASKSKVKGTVAEIYTRIKDNYSGCKSELPRSPSHFSRKVTAEYHTLQAVGLIVNIDPTPADATYIEIIKKSK